MHTYTCKNCGKEKQAKYKSHREQDRIKITEV